jgi:hypothetical protein
MDLDDVGRLTSLFKLIVGYLVVHKIPICPKGSKQVLIC